jgi:hypothetical protein
MSISRNFDYLPANVLALSGYDFFQFIKTTLGEPEANLLNKISVKTTSGFLLIDDPLEILKYDIEDAELEKLKDELTFKLKNQKFLVKPGIISGFRSLKDALEKKLNEQLKKSKKKQQQQQQLFNFNSSTMSSLTTTTAQVTTVPDTLSLSDHKAYVLEFIRKWCSENKENFNLDNFNLEEGVDFQLNIDFDENFDVKARVKCKCSKLISLSKNNNKIQVSNYYKHLQSKGCDHMKNIKKAARDLRSIQQQQQQSSTPVTLTSSSQSYVPLLQVPAVPLTTTQSASHSNSPALSNQSTHNGKRRLPSQSQQHQPSKRSRM